MPRTSPHNFLAAVIDKTQSDDLHVAAFTILIVHQVRRTMCIFPRHRTEVLPDCITSVPRKGSTPMFQDDRTAANGLHLIQIMRHKNQRRTAVNELSHPIQAAQPKDGIPHRQHLIDQQHLGVYVGGDAKAQPGVHP